MSEFKKYTFHIEGLHCKSCVILTESKIGEFEGVNKVKTDLHSRTVSILGNFENKNTNEIIFEINKSLEPHGYRLTENREEVSKKIKWQDFKIAIPVAVVFIALFVLLQKLGIVNTLNIKEMSFVGAFLIGVVASLSTCMAVVGALTLSLSATFAKSNSGARPQILFHVGRLISFFVLGGLLGIVGGFVSFGAVSTFILGMMVGLVMLVLGINLLDIWNWSKRVHISMPKFISKHAFEVSKLNHSLTPLVVGVATFFLPCGFTQSMQVYTLSTGSFIAGAFVMFAFALGTLPVLALVSFGSFSIKDAKYAGVLWKSAGLVVIAFAIINIINSLAVVGLIQPIINF